MAFSLAEHKIVEDMTNYTALGPIIVGDGCLIARTSILASVIVKGELSNAGFTHLEGTSAQEHDRNLPTSNR